MVRLFTDLRNSQDRFLVCLVACLCRMACRPEVLQRVLQGNPLECLHAVLKVPAAVRIPACDDMWVIVRALLAVDEYVQSRHPARGLQMMRMAVAAKESGEAPSLAAVLRIHRGKVGATWVL